MMVNALYVAAPLGIALCTLLAQRLSLLLGRLQTTLLCKFLGVGLLLAIAYLPLSSPHAPYYILPMYLVRTWLMNAPTSLTKSVLNDYVPKKHRYMQSMPSILRTHTAHYLPLFSLTLHTLLALHTHIQTQSKVEQPRVAQHLLVVWVGRVGWPTDRQAGLPEDLCHHGDHAVRGRPVLRAAARVSAGGEWEQGLRGTAAAASRGWLLRRERSTRRQPPAAMD